MENRIIKFRAWHTTMNQMFSAEEMVVDQMALLTDGRFCNVHGDDTSKSTFPPMIPMQFTGLLDKNGKEIYEGDVVRKESQSYWKNEDDEPDAMDVELFSGGTGKVIAIAFGFYIEDIKCGSWCFNGPEGREWSNFEIEVIGNIYENPELLNPTL